MLLSLVVTLPAQAEFAAAHVVAGSPIYDGLKGVAGIRTDPATVQGIGYVHPVQIDIGAIGNDFVAVGTANGAGVPGTFCADHYDARWDIYVDWEIGGVYQCRDISINAYGISTQSFQLTWSFCESANANRWVLTRASTDRWCVNSSSHAGQALNAGLETTGGSTTDRNIDVKYTSVQFSLTGSGSWSNIGFLGGGVVVDLNYTVDSVSTSAFNTYLAPLD